MEAVVCFVEKKFSVDILSSFKVGSFMFNIENFIDAKRTQEKNMLSCTQKVVRKILLTMFLM